MTTRQARRSCFQALLLAACALVPRAGGQESGPADDNYAFDARSSEERTVTLERTPNGLRLAWPAAGAWDTALLGVRSAGAEPTAWVEISAGGARLEQHLDLGARGLRWLNLGGLREALKDGAEIGLITHGVTLEPGPAPLRLFSNRLDLGGTILVLAPHPDDAEIAAFGLYAGRNATIVTLTSGNAGDFNYRANVSDPAEHYLLKGYLRAVDSVSVPWLGGIPPERCFNLGYFDARLASMHAKPDEAVPEMYGPNRDVAPYRRANVSRLLPNASRTNTWTHLVEDLAAVFDKVRPALIVMPHPLLDTHPDHAYAALAAVEALGQRGADARFLVYTNHSGANRYPYGPAGTVTSLPPWPGPALAVQGVYAHALAPDLQLRKLFALESMHDLRLSPAEQAACGTPGLPRRDDYPRVPEVDYFRRGVRANELFFVFDREGARALARAFLDARERAPREEPRP